MSKVMMVAISSMIQVSLHKFLINCVELGSAINAIGVTLIVLSMIITGYFLAKTAPLLIAKAWRGALKDKLNIFAYLQRLLMNIYYFLTDFDVLYYMIYGTTAIIGLTVSPFFFGFHLFDVLVRYPTLLNVVKSVWIPKKSLLLTFFLMVIINYVYSLIGYYQFYRDYNGWCESTFMCWLTGTDKSFKVDGGLGGFMENPFKDGAPDLLRFAFDNTYFLLVLVVMLNILLGIIIDTFRTLREHEKSFQYDVRNICFICGHDRETLDKASDSKNGFLAHLKQDHYLWNYLFYIGYLKSKDRTEYSGIESYVMEKIEASDVTWFPSHR
jgi:hypothetical protein